MTSSGLGRQAEQQARRARANPVLRGLARGGYLASGLIQLIVGVIAIEVALHRTSSSADQSGALADLAKAPGGPVLLWIVTVGALALALWLAIAGALEHGTDGKDTWGRRIRDWAKAVVYAAIAGVLAAALLAGDPKEEAAKTVPKTVKETVTLPATTVVQTVTTEAATTAPETAAPSGRPSELNDQGFALMQAGNYKAALPLLEEYEFDLLLSDIVMPEMDGIELAQRCSEVSPRTKVMFITGFAAVSLKSNREVPQTKVLSKPFHLKDLVLEVERMFEDRATASL